MGPDKKTVRIPKILILRIQEGFLVILFILYALYKVADEASHRRTDKPYPPSYSMDHTRVSSRQETASCFLR